MNASFHWRGEHLELLGVRAALDPRRGVLLVADVHLGKAETFQVHGVPLPSDGDAGSLNRLLELSHRHRPHRVVVLGDLIHSRLGLTAELRAKLAALPELLGCALELVGGNHERGSWIAGLPQQPSQALGPWWLSHEPEPRPGLLNICGHLHPVAVIGRGADRLRLPCFSYDPRAERLALPAFGELTGGHPSPTGERQWLVAEGAVVPWSAADGAALRPRRPGPAPRRRG
ncbi:ligase-associated DNA damage response endonuclease PdeM [Cyanobium sp. CH-040]|uniref:ligase-associated DNA damage response endonuclease PdeM n=1 Tax=Cyanobium sp. CH-040 TaxID=2823708 RepID=UPI0020CD0C9C|nr:ligase-associated DNA damage response endonuclease PdeM [Cyanobium sp. CH-040]MCP9927516.1 ligase-associated DNA damage response endonuclease PdeM [Cyanobium sp. CH-040]